MGAEQRTKRSSGAAASASAPTRGRQLLCATVGNSITGLSLFGGTDWNPASEVHIANTLAGAPLRFARMASTTYSDIYGLYGRSGGRMWQILPDLDSMLFTPWRNAGLAPDVVLLTALLENDIGDAETTANCIRRVRELMTTLRRWWNVRIVIGTPHPSTSYNTAAKKQIYAEMRDHILSLHDGVDVFVYRNDGYADPTDPSQPAAGYTDGVHPNPKGAFVTGRALAAVLRQVNPLPAMSRRLQHPNLALSGSVAISGSNIAGGSTGPTGFSASGVGAGKTVTFLAEQSGLLMTVAQTLGGNNDAGLVLTGSQAVAGSAATEVSSLIEVEIVSGASLIRQIDMRHNVTDGGGAVDRRFMFNGGTAEDCDYRDGDILTLVIPPYRAGSGTITAVEPRLNVRAKTGTGGGSTAIVGGTYQLRIRAVGVLIDTPEPTRVWRASATTVSGIATFDLTPAGFASVAGAIATPLIDAASAVAVPMAGIKALTTTQATVSVVRGRTLASLGDTTEYVPDGTTVYLEVWGDGG